ncbi:hypothetical protein [Pseudoalteromonas sp. T1lg88]|uniref:hypothetical protein n=1 Tax=Pseudoalteromonas sp. T1lg88 TaxID=2077104 RepID=UPI0018FE88DC|nr:hypothetical protein [Pseudoalteromonas sp. T1lg88]
MSQIKPGTRLPDSPVNPHLHSLTASSAAVLASAKRFGIGHLLAVATPDSKQPSRQLAGV